MRKRILATLLSVIMIIGLLPVTSLAAKTFTCTIQAVIIDEDGNWESTNKLPSKSFSGTTNGGYSSPGTTWQWIPSGNNEYTITSQQNTNVNASAYLKYPTDLWTYNSKELKLVGMGSNSYSTTNDYNVAEADLSYDWKFEKLSFSITNPSSEYITYIFQRQSTKPTAPSDSELKVLLENNAVTVECTNNSVEHEQDPITYGLLENSYTIGTVTGNSSSGYTCTITVNPALYVARVQ